MDFTIKNIANEGLPVGTHPATFRGVEQTQTSKGDAVRWKFQTDSGKNFAPFSDLNATTGNKTGRWLAALSSKPQVDGTKVTPDDYVGKRYLLIVESDGNGGTRLNTFTAI